uniref:Uncharacterized protein n=1 Tax=Arundo donax TaxID=35708 RepID=A0A0A9BQV0_ARUDO
MFLSSIRKNYPEGMVQNRSSSNYTLAILSA